MAENDWTQDFYLKRGYTDKWELESAIEDIKSRIQFYRDTLMLNIIATPSTIIPEEWKEDAAMFIRNSTTDTLDAYEEDLILLFKLESLLENFDTATKSP